MAKFTNRFCTKNFNNNFGDDFMSSKLDALKAAFAPKKNDDAAGKKFTQMYQFWKMNAGEQATVRFLPDANPNNERQFLVENLTHSLTINGKKRVIACLEMYDGHGACPACQLSREYYAKAKSAGETKDTPGPLTALGKKYYKKKEYIGQVKVQTSPIDFEKNEGHEHEMPISIGPQIYKLIQAAFASGDLEEVPYELKGGYDFRLMKVDQGGNANYTLSKFVPKQSDVDDDTIAQLNLYDLSTLRNRRTDAATISAMIEADRNGTPFTAPGATPTSNGTAPSPDEDDDSDTPFATPAVEAAVTSQVQATPVAAQASDTKVNDVLAQIRARAAANKAA